MKPQIVSLFFSLIWLVLTSIFYISLNVELEKSNILKRQMKGIFCDICNAMFGKHNSVVQRLKQNNPHIVTVKCSCHISHLCWLKAIAMLPSLLEEFLRHLSSVFSSIYKNMDELVEFKKVCLSLLSIYIGMSYQNPSITLHFFATNIYFLTILIIHLCCK